MQLGNTVRSGTPPTLLGPAHALQHGVAVYPQLLGCGRQPALSVKHCQQGPSFRLLPAPLHGQSTQLGRDEGTGHVQVAAHRVHQRQLGIRRHPSRPPGQLDDPTAALRLDVGIPEAGRALRRCADADPDHLGDLARQRREVARCNGRNARGADPPPQRARAVRDE